MTDIADRLDDIHQRINQVCGEAGRDPSEVHLLAVSKAQGLDKIREAWQCGQAHFGENYLQEALQKIEALPRARWHFIGAIQGNKTRHIANNFDWVHSVSSLKVARRLSDQRDSARGDLNLLMQVNTSGEDAKSGIAAEEACALAGNIEALPRIRLRGLMTIPEASIEEAAQRQRFGRLRALRDSIRDRLRLEDFDQLSMGMTGDFPAAIMEGATWVRIGTAIFGSRHQI